MWWGISLCVTLVVSLALLAAFHPLFELNDDTTIQYYLSGARTGIPDGYTVYSNYALSWLLSRLFVCFPRLPWWSIFQICVVALSSATVGKAILTSCHRQKRSLAFGVILYLLVELAFFSLPLVVIQYTVTSACAGAAAISMVLTAKKAPGSTFRLDASVAAVFLLLSFCIRIQPFLLSAVFLLAALVYRAVGLRPQTLKSIRPSIPYGAVTVACMVVCVCINASAYSTSDWQEYDSYNSARTAYIDYPHATYEDTPELHESVGWNATLTELVDQWFFLDPSVNESSFRALAGSGATQSFGESVGQTSSTLVEAFSTRLSQAELLLLLVCLISVALGARSRHTSVARYMAPALCLTTAVILGYLAWEGRLPQRALQSVLIPSCCTALMVSIQVGLGPRRDVRATRDGPSGMKVVGMAANNYKAIAIGALLLLTGILSVRSVSSFSAMNTDSNTVVETIDSYCEGHKDTVFIKTSDIPDGLDSNITYAPGDLANQFSWGGWTTYSPLYYGQLSLNGKEALSCESFLEDDVLLVARADSNSSSMLLSYINQKYGMDAHWDCVDTIAPGIGAYRLVTDS